MSFLMEEHDTGHGGRLGYVICYVKKPLVVSMRAVHALCEEGG